MIQKIVWGLFVVFILTSCQNSDHSQDSNTTVEINTEDSNTSDTNLSYALVPIETLQLAQLRNIDGGTVHNIKIQEREVRQRIISIYKKMDEKILLEAFDYRQRSLSVIALDYNGSVEQSSSISLPESHLYFDTVHSSDDELIISTLGEYNTTIDADTFFVSKYILNDSIDTSFGINGKTTLHKNVVGDNVLLHIDSLGRIIVAYTSIVRLLSDGTIDNSFDLKQNYLPIEHLITDDSNRILFVGKGYDDQKESFYTVLSRIDENGSADPTFNDGKSLLLADVNSSIPFLVKPKILMDSNENIFLLGTVDRHPTLLKFSPNGVLFNTININAEAYYGVDAFVGDNDDIYVVGFGDLDFYTGMTLVHYFSDGTLDQSFGNGGSMKISVGFFSDYGVKMVRLNNSILVASSNRSVVFPLTNYTTLQMQSLDLNETEATPNTFEFEKLLEFSSSNFPTKDVEVIRDPEVFKELLSFDGKDSESFNIDFEKESVLIVSYSTGCGELPQITSIDNYEGKAMVSIQYPQTSCGASGSGIFFTLYRVKNSAHRTLVYRRQINQ
jgi:hypothetical protein